MVAAALLPGLSALAAEPSSSVRDATAYVTDGAVHAVAHVPGGPTYIGGDFAHVGPRSGHGLALGAVGSADAAAPLGSAAGTQPLPGGVEFPEVAGGEVHAVASDGNGGWFIGGSFTSVGGEDVPYLAHILPSGQPDPGWAPEPNGPVRALALDTETDGENWTLYAGGDFTELNSQEIRQRSKRSFLAAWRVRDGAPWTPGEDPLDPGNDFENEEPLSWNPGQKTDNRVRALAVTRVTVNLGAAPGTPTPTPVVFAGGDFTTLGTDGVTRRGVGAVWGQEARKPEGNAEARSLEWNPNLNAGARVEAFALGSPVPNPTDTHTVVPVYFGGEFTNGVAPAPVRTNLAASRLRVDKATGSAAHAYYGWMANPDARVRALRLSGGVLYAGGDFALVGPPAAPAERKPRAHLAALAAVPDALVNPDGACPETACRATVRDWQPDPDGIVRALGTAPGGEVVYAGGDFTSVGAGTVAARGGLVALVASGMTGPSGEAEGAALAWDPRLAGGPVNALALEGDALYAAGGFFSYAAVPRANLAALDPAGALIEGFDTGTGCEGGGCADEIRALELAPDGSQLYVGGAFTTVGGEQREHLAALDLGLAGAVVAGWAPNPDGWVLTLDAAGQRLYAGGAFDRIGAPVDGTQPARNRLAALERATGVVLDWDPNARCVEPSPSCSPYGVYAVEASCDGVYVGGRFDRIGAAAPGAQPVRTNIAKLDPFTAAAAAWDPNPEGNPGAVRALAAHGGTVYAGGGFAELGGAVRQRLAALDANGGWATSWNPVPDGVVEAIAVSGDGQTVFAGGEFTQIGDAERWGLAALSASGLGNATAWDPSVREPDPTGAPSRSVAEAIAVSGGNVYAGGRFTDVGTSAQRGYAQFTSGGEGAAGEPLACAGEPGQGQGSPQPADSRAPSVGRAFVADGGRTLVVFLSEAARIHVELTGSGPGLMPMGRGATCAPDSAKLRGELRRAMRAKLRNLSARARARKLRKLIAKRACTAQLAPRSIDADGAVGENRISLAGARPLAPGSYRATITARDAAGNQAQPVTINFGVGP